MISVVDASLLLSLVSDDEHSEAAEKWWHTNYGVVLVPELAAYEARNVLRSFGIRGVLAEAELVEARCALGVLSNVEFSLRSLRHRLLIAESERLLNHFSPGVPHGAMDVLHVAAAKLLQADCFVSFDGNQRELAAAAGLEVLP